MNTTTLDGEPRGETPSPDETGTTASAEKPAYTVRAISELRPHKYNVDIYGDAPVDAAFLESVKTRGIYVPLIVTPKGDIISGHRRYAAAVAIGLKEVPAIVRAFADELEEREALLDNNYQRIKTNVQLTREFLARKDIEAQRAKLRMATNTTSGVKELAQAETGKARDKAAEPLGKTGTTMEKGEKVVGFIDSLRKKKKDKKADELESALNQSFDAGLKKAKDLGLIKPPGSGGKKGAAKTAGENTAAPPAGETGKAGVAEGAGGNEQAGASASPVEGTIEKTEDAVALDHAVALAAYVMKTPAKKLDAMERKHWDGVLGPVVKWFKSLAD
jgi:hypothetical protein